MALGRGKRIFGLIARELPGTVLCKDMLVVVPTERILRGFLLETTIEKNLVYLWRVVTPLHRPMRHPFLNYSDRIGGDKVFIDPSAYRQSADVVRAIILEHIAYLQGIRNHEDFLRHVAWMKGNDSFHFRLDLALTYSRIGRADEARAILHSLAEGLNTPEEKRFESKYPRFREFNDGVRLAAKTAEAGPTEMTALIDAWEKQNIETLGLQPSLAVTIDPDGNAS